MARVDLLLKAGHSQLAQDTIKKEAVSADMVTIGQKVLYDIVTNGTHHQNLKTVKFVSFADYKKITLQKKKRTILEDWVLGIEKVEEIQTDDIRTRGYIIYHQDGVMNLPFYKVHSSTYKKKGSHMVGKPNFDVNSSHYRYFIDRGRSHTSVSYERLVMIADGVL